MGASDINNRLNSKDRCVLFTRARRDVRCMRVPWHAWVGCVSAKFAYAEHQIKQLDHLITVSLNVRREITREILLKRGRRNTIQPEVLVKLKRFSVK